MKNIHHITVGGIATNCWIYPLGENGGINAAGLSSCAGGTCAVIDPGEEGSRIIAFLDQLKLFPQYILLTHGHLDHIAAVPALVKKYGAAEGKDGGGPVGAMAPVLAIHSADADYLGPNAYPVHCHSFDVGMGSSAFVESIWEDDLPPPNRILAEGDTIGPFTVLSLPGHTPGSVGFWDKEAGVLFSGDTLFCDGYGRTDLPGGDMMQLVDSLKRLFAMNGNIQVYPGHGPATTIANER